MTSGLLPVLVPLVPLFPLAGVLLNLAFGKRLPRGAVAAVACGAVLLSFLASVASRRLIQS